MDKINFNFSNNKKLKILLEGSIVISLSFILDYFVLFKMPYGGSLTLSLIPIFVFSLRHKIKKGLFVGFIYGFMNFLFNYKYSFHPLSIILDYIIPGMSIGFISIKKKLILGFLIVYLIKFTSVFLSGIILWNIYAGGMNSILYSITYNLCYIIPEFILNFIFLSILKKAYVNI